MCGQCGREMTGLFPRERDELAHELQAGVALNLRVFADNSHPDKIGVVTMRISEDGLNVGWLGDEHFKMEWHELLDILHRAEWENTELESVDS
jgi:hypothetical protein